MIEFSITDEADQKFSTVAAGRRVTVRLWFSVFSDRWSMDLSIDGEPVLNGRKIVTGVDLLAPFDFDIGVIFAYSDSDAAPGRGQLPEGTVKIYHATQGEINASVAS